MADLKISQLTGATTPLAGTEVLPIVQGSTTKKVTVANLTASGAYPGYFTVIGATKATAGDALTFTNGGATPGTGYLYTGSGVVGLYLAANASGAGYQLASSGAYIYSPSQSNYVAITNTGVTFAGTNLIQGTAAKGVNFTANTPAAGMTSQLLNWYEEGTWTPNQGSGLVVVGAFSSSGTYTRVGRQVTVVGTIRGGTSVSASSAGQITSNLPFTASNLFVGSVINDTVTTSSGIYTSSASINAVEAITATPAIYFSITYFV